MQVLLNGEIFHLADGGIIHGEPSGQAFRRVLATINGYVRVSVSRACVQAADRGNHRQQKADFQSDTGFRRVESAE